MASETVDPIDWSHPPPCTGQHPLSSTYCTVQCELQITKLTALIEMRTCDLRSARPTHCLCGYSGYKIDINTIQLTSIQSDVNTWGPDRPIQYTVMSIHEGQIGRSNTQSDVKTWRPDWPIQYTKWCQYMKARLADPIHKVMSLHEGQVGRSDTWFTTSRTVPSI